MENDLLQVPPIWISPYLNSTQLRARGDPWPHLGVQGGGLPPPAVFVQQSGFVRELVEITNIAPGTIARQSGRQDHFYMRNIQKIFPIFPSFTQIWRDGFKRIEAVPVSVQEEKGVMPEVLHHLLPPRCLAVEQGRSGLTD